MLQVLRIPDHPVTSVQGEMLYLSYASDPQSFIVSTWTSLMLKTQGTRSTNHDLSSSGSLPVLVKGSDAICGKQLLDYCLLKNNDSAIGSAEFYAFYSLVVADLVPALIPCVQMDLEQFTLEHPWPLNYMIYAKNIYNKERENVSMDQLNKVAGVVLVTFEKRLSTDTYFGGLKVNVLDYFVFSTLYAIDKGGNDKLKKMVLESMVLQRFLENFKIYLKNQEISL